MRKGLIVTIASGIVNFGLSLLKIFIGIVSNSITIFFDAINNMLDVAGSALGGVGYYVKDKRPSRHYPSGYGAVEHIVSLIISLGTLIFGGLFVFYSVERIVYPLPVYFAWLYFWLLLLTAGVKLAMGLVYLHLYRREHSDITRSLYIDSFMDASITTCLVICYAVAQSTDVVVDAILGVVLGIIIMVATIKAIVRSIRALMGYSDVDIVSIRDELIECGAYESIEDMRVEGRTLYIRGTLCEAHGYVARIAREHHVEIFDVRDMGEDNGTRTQEDE